MLSSISSSNQRLPRAEWPRVLGGGLLTLLLLACTMELRLALRGFSPAPRDSAELWAQQRVRASALGSRAVILLGASRIQVDTDLDVLRDRSGLEPVQLAIDGSDFQPVLADLASDPAVRGVVVVDVSDSVMASPLSRDRAAEWVEAFARRGSPSGVPDFSRIESALESRWRGALRSYADGARPLDSILTRLLPAHPMPQYLLLRDDRSRSADYRRVQMPEFYFQRVMRNLGETRRLADGTRFSDLDAELRRQIATLAPATASLERYLAAGRALAAQAAAIEARGGRVLFAALPKSGLVRDIDERRFPRAQFWDRFVSENGVRALHFEDMPAWRGLSCPDGSHLDFRQRAAFTTALAEALPR